MSRQSRAISDRLHLEGDWPGPVTIRSGWAKATARPWNDDGGIALRLLRGNSDFLRQSGLLMERLGGGGVFSPALHPAATRVWERAGFSPVARLGIMERSLGTPVPAPGRPVDLVTDPDWAQLVALDREAFAGWWRMGEEGLREAMDATPHSTLLTVGEAGRLHGYALVGAQMGVSFLQRVAVDPSRGGTGKGTALLRAALEWGRVRGTRVMVLNVRPENQRARRLYHREGFVDSGGNLMVLGFDR